MREIMVEGYVVTVERSEGAYIVSVPDLPGCTIQVDREEDAKGRIARVIGDYLVEMVKRKPAERPGNQAKKRRPEEPVKLRR